MKLTQEQHNRLKEAMREPMEQGGLKHFKSHGLDDTTLILFFGSAFMGENEIFNVITEAPKDDLTQIIKELEDEHNQKSV